MSSLYTTSYSNPEQVLKAAEEFQNLGKEIAAYDSLYTFMTNTKTKQWSQALERIMLLLIKLSLGNNRAQNLGEALRTYKNATQYSNITSLEQVLDRYCFMAEDILEQTVKKTDDYKKLLDLEDLEEGDNTELYVNSVSTDSRSKTEELRNAWKLVWDTYRTILDCICKNKKLEELYQKIAIKAFEFCKKYNRKVEAKRLFDSLRSNLTGIIRTMERNPDFQKIPFVIDLTNPETNEIQLNIRLSQLQYAYHFELWQEALRTLEDINNIMQKSNTLTKPKILSEYFENLAKMFWKSDFYMYHAYAFFQHFSLVRSRSRLTPEELSLKSSYLILSILSIPPLKNEQDQSDDSQYKAISLLSSSRTIPKKEELLTYVTRHNIIDLCAPEVRELFLIMENSSDVVTLAKRVEPLLKKLEDKKELSMFQTQIQNVVVYKVLADLSKIYKTIKVDKLKKFIGTIPYTICENILHYSAISHYINIRIDQGKGLIVFRSGRQDLQSMSMKISSISEEIKDIVSRMETKLNEANEASYRETLRNEAQAFCENAAVELDHRRRIVQDLRKGEKAKARQEEESAKIERIREEERMTQEAKDREKKEKQEEKKKVIMKELNKVDIINRTKIAKELKNMKNIKINGKKITEYAEAELVAMDMSVLEDVKAKAALEEKAKEENKLNGLYKKIDYLERAKREESVPILQETWKGSQEDKDEVLKQHKEAFDKNQEMRKTLLLVRKLKDQQTGKLLEQRKADYEKDIAAFKKMVNDALKEQILNSAKESLEQKKKDIEEAEIRRKEEAAKRKKELEQQAASGVKQDDDNMVMSRSTLTFKGGASAGTTAAPSGSGNLIRSTITRDAPKDNVQRSSDSAGGITRNVGGIARKDEPKETTADASSKFGRSTASTTTGERPQMKWITAKKTDAPEASKTTSISSTTSGITRGFIGGASKDEQPATRTIGRSIGGNDNAKRDDKKEQPNKFLSRKTADGWNIAK